MNEEISRILQMLEAGKIGAAEAEGLIRALKEQAPAQQTEARRASRPNACAEAVQMLARAARRARQAQLRNQWWRYYHARAWHENARRQRSQTMGTAERVRWVLVERAMADPEGLTLASRLAEDLGLDQMAWENLAFGVRDELGIETSAAELRKLPTLQALIDYVVARTAPAARPAPEPAATSPDAGSPAAEVSTTGPADAPSSDDAVDGA